MDSQSQQSNLNDIRKQDERNFAENRFYQEKNRVEKYCDRKM